MQRVGRFLGNDDFRFIKFLIKKVTKPTLSRSIFKNKRLKQNRFQSIKNQLEERNSTLLIINGSLVWRELKTGMHCIFFILYDRLIRVYISVLQLR